MIDEAADLLLLLLPPGGGDELQGVKKGIMEVRREEEERGRGFVMVVGM